MRNLVYHSGDRKRLFQAMMDLETSAISHKGETFCLIQRNGEFCHKPAADLRKNARVLYWEVCPTNCDLTVDDMDMAFCQDMVEIVDTVLEMNFTEASLDRGYDIEKGWM